MSYAYSPSQIKDFLRCPRSWWTRTIAHAPDDATAGGQYLVSGRMFDEIIGLHVIGMPLDAGEVVVRSVRESRGVGLTPAQLTEMYERALRQLRASAHLFPAPRTASTQWKYRVAVPGMPDTYITGKADLRRPGHIWDAKTTSDRGPGRGKDAQSAPNQYTAADGARPLRDDVQAAVYAWCEFQLNPHLVYARATWVYVTKPPSGGSPSAWAVDHVFSRADTLAWFDRVVRPAIVEMTRLSDVRGAFLVAADHDGCSMCFVKLSCSPFEGLQRTNQGPDVMAFDLNKARRAAGLPAAEIVPEHEPSADTLVTQLATSVAINRPRGPVVDTTGELVQDERQATAGAAAVIEHQLDVARHADLVVDPDDGPDAAPAVAGREAIAAAIESQAAAPPKARRTRKPRGAAAPVAVSSGSADALYQEAEAIATSVQTLIDRLSGVLTDLDKRIATLLAARGAGGGS